MALKTSPLSEFTDYRGNTVRVGDVVSYSALSGRSAQQVEATVLDIHLVYPAYGSGNSSTRMRLKPTGRTSRWTQHEVRELVLDDKGNVVYDVDGRAVWVPKDIKPVLVAAEMVVKVEQTT